MAIKLLITALYNALLVILLYFIDKKTKFKKFSYKKKQFIYGILFGAMAIFSSTNFGGIDIGNGIIMNVRDASPLCAGLIFGAPAGIIAGLIGGIYRFFASFVGLAGSYTQIACSISTIMAGVLAGVLRKYMFDDKKPTWIYGVGIGMICEVIHMLMIFFTNMGDAKTAFEFVKICTIPMMLGNGISVGISILLISYFHREKNKKKHEQKQISQTFQFWLFVCIVIAYISTSSFSSIIQTGMSQKETETIIKTNLEDVYRDISDASNENLLSKVKLIREEYLNGADLSKLAYKYNVIEINIIDENGIIVDTNNKEFVGYDMSSGTQSAEFLVLIDGDVKEYVQDYRPTSYDNLTYRKYGASTLNNGGFIQVGYDASQFRTDIDTYVGSVARNRHVGNKGFVAICDEKFNIVTENNEYSGQNINKIGIQLNPSEIEPGRIFETTVLGISYLAAYKFVEGYYIIGAMPFEEAMFMKEVSVYISTFMQVIIFAILFVLIYFLIKKVVIDNIKKINNTLSEITGGNLDVIVDVRTNKEFASLSDDINSTVSVLKGYIDEAASRIDKELEFAKQIQYSSIPTSFPNKKEFELYAEMITAKEVGGDFYDFYMLNDNTVAFLVADVSGKGIPAAMFMMKAKTIIKDLAESGIELDEIFTKANEKLCENNEAGMFVTVWMAILDLQTGTLKFANAGHNPPLIRRLNGKYEYIKMRPGLVMAGMEGIKYKKNEIKLYPGDQILLYTDGVTEATNINQELYGEERLINFLNESNDTNTKKICTKIKEEIDKFVGKAPQFDDITLLSLTLKCIRSDTQIIVNLNGEAQNIINEFAEKIIQKLETVPKIANKINIIIDEIYSNIINYSKANLLQISYVIENGQISLIFMDDGVFYNPLENKDPNVKLSAEERDIGGLGFFMVKKLAQNVEYKYEDNKNILKVVISIY